MRRVITAFGKLLRQTSPQRPLTRQRPRLQLEALEDRSLLAATITGFAFADVNNSGVFNASATLQGITVSLTGTAGTSKAVIQTTITDGNGEFTFENVPTGTFQLQATTPGYLLGNVSLGNVTLASGVSVAGLSSPTTMGVEDAGTAGFQAPIIGGQMFLSSRAGFPFGSAGGGVISAADTPFIKTAVSEILAGQGATNVIDLAGHFSDSGLVNGTELQFNLSVGGKTDTLFVTLDDQTAPQTVANFLDYVNSGAYNNSIFHRLSSGFVLQGGGFKLPSGNPLTFPTIPALPAVPGEFSASNVANTIAMAQSTGPNSATNEFFFNLVDNSSKLDSQSFTVFGALGGVSDPGGTMSTEALTDMTSAPVNASNQSSTNGAFGPISAGDNSGIPLSGGPNATISASPNGATEDASGNVTITTTAPVPFQVGQQATISGVGVAGYNGTFTITAVSGNTFTYTDTTTGLTASGGGTVTAQSSGTIAASPNGATESGSTVTVTTTTPGGFQVGQQVTIAGVGVSGYNGTFTIASTPTPTTFTYTDTTTGLAASGGGTATANSFATNDPNFLTDVANNNLVFISSVNVVPGTQKEALTYTVSSSNSSLVSATLTNEQLTLTNSTTQTGTATITVQATDQFGNTATTTFTVDVLAATVTPSTGLTTTSVLTANVAGADSSTSFTYQWLMNGTAIPSGQTGTSPMLDLSKVTGVAAGQNQMFTVQVTPSEAGVTGSVITSPAVTLL
jgi:cyclophilin family peptidyl-prolyl cis-trans isomerase